MDHLRNFDSLRLHGVKLYIFLLVLYWQPVVRVWAAVHWSIDCWWLLVLYIYKSPNLLIKFVIMSIGSTYRMSKDSGIANEGSIEVVQANLAIG